jgi:4-hydroxy-tetrahydrodipicolinate reductase
MIKVAVWGAGMMGQGLLRYILERPKDVELVGVIDRHPEKHGMTLGGLLGEVEHDMQITADIDAVLALHPDVVCILTASNLHEITDQVEAAIRAEADVICIAETLAYPWASDPAWADRIDALAREHGVSVLGTGINPGFVLDALPIALSSVCMRIDRIEAARINDLSPFGPTVMSSQGVGTTVEQFEAGLADGSIVGHIGFQESVGLIAYALGWEIDEVVETREPIVSTVERSTPHVHVSPGEVAGCRHIARAYSKGELKIELVHPQQIHPELEGVETGDYLTIVGDPNVSFHDGPEIPGGKGTYASVGNYIPLMGAAPAGVVTVVDMPLPRFWAPTA